MRKCGIKWYNLSIFFSNLSVILFLTFFISSCEKAIHINLNDAQSKLVVEATIENGKAPIVFLSNSLDYFSEISPDILENSFVHNADVAISDGMTTQHLKEYNVVADTSGNKIYFYTSDSTDVNYFVGSFDKTYSL